MQQTYVVQDEFHFDISVSYKRSGGRRRRRKRLTNSFKFHDSNVQEECQAEHSTFSQIYYVTERKARETERAWEGREYARMRAQWVGLIWLNWLQKKIPLNLLHPHICARTYTQTQGTQHTNANGVNGWSKNWSATMKRPIDAIFCRRCTEWPPNASK